MQEEEEEKEFIQEEEEEEEQEREEQEVIQEEEEEEEEGLGLFWDCLSRPPPTSLGIASRVQGPNIPIRFLPSRITQPSALCRRKRNEVVVTSSCAHLSLSLFDLLLCAPHTGAQTDAA